MAIRSVTVTGRWFSLHSMPPRSWFHLEAPRTAGHRVVAVHLALMPLAMSACTIHHLD